MSEKARLFSLILIMATVALASALVAGGILYQASFEEQRSRLKEMAESQARLIEATARHSQEMHGKGREDLVVKDTLKRLFGTHHGYEEHIEAVEYVLARRDDGNIQFLFRHRHSDANAPSLPIPWEAEWAEPMRRALSGRSGSTIALDYRGKTVLAAYEPVKNLNWGIVVKLDLAVVRSPFIKAGMISALLTLILTIAGALSFRRVFDPISRKIRESEERLRSVVQSTRDAIITANEHGIIISWNKGAEDVFGYGEEEIIGCPVTDLMAERYWRDHLKGVKRIITGGEPRVSGKTVELYALRKDGSEFPIEMSLSNWNIGDSTFFSGIIRDITERKQAEEDMKKAKVEAEAANNAKSEFLASMSHDLRTPLNAIMGLSELMGTRVFGPLGDSHYEDYAKDIHASGELLVSLINDLLDLSKIEAGEYQLKEENIDLATLVNKAAAIAACGEQQPKVKVVIAPGFPELRGDERAIIQILNNLLSNAIKFTPQGGKVNVTLEIDDERWIILIIEDNGIGMSEHDISKVLKPFEQIDSSQPSKYEGTGLGLFISRKLLEMHGGSLGIVSVIDKGTTVTARFPPERVVGDALGH